MLQRHRIRFTLIAIVQLISQNSDPLPAGIEGHTAGEHIFCRIYRTAGEVRGEIPAHEVIAVIVRQNVFQRGLSYLMGSISVTFVFRFIAGENLGGIDNFHFFTVNFLRPSSGDVGRPSLRSAKIYRDIHSPIGVQGDITVDLLREVIRLALTGCVVIPACKGQTFDIRIRRPRDGAAFLRIRTAVGTKVAVVILEIRLIAAHTMENNLYIMRRHGEGDFVSIRGVL